MARSGEMAGKSRFAQQAWQHCYEAGNTFLQQGNLRNAAKAFSDALEACTDPAVRANIFYARAYVYWSAGHFATAIEDLTKSIAMNDELADAYNLRGVCHARTKQVEPAISDFTRAIELGMDDASPFLNRAKTFLELGLLEFALPDLIDAIERDEQHSSWLSKLVKELSNELTLNRCATTYANRALALHYSGCSDAAIEDINLGLSLARSAKETAFVMARVAQIRICEGDFLGAITECSKAVQFDPDCTLAFWLAGLAYVGLGHVEEAQTTFAHCQSVATQQNFAGADHYLRACETELIELALPPAAASTAFVA
jgi:tetratricopeptide (TPR) repeat protein